jgi:hypothetical protein
MPEPHRRGVAIANGFSKGKCDEIPPQARFFLYKKCPSNHVGRAQKAIIMFYPI